MPVIPPTVIVARVHPLALPARAARAARAWAARPAAISRGHHLGLFTGYAAFAATAAFAILAHR